MSAKQSIRAALVLGLLAGVACMAAIPAEPIPKGTTVSGEPLTVRSDDRWKNQDGIWTIHAVAPLDVASEALIPLFGDTASWDVVALESRIGLAGRYDLTLHDCRTTEGLVIGAATFGGSADPFRVVMGIRGRTAESPDGVLRIVRLRGSAVEWSADFPLSGSACPPLIGTAELDDPEKDWLRIRRPEAPPSDLSWFPHRLLNGEAVTHKLLYLWSWNGRWSAWIAVRKCPKTIPHGLELGTIPLNEEQWRLEKLPLTDWPYAVLAMDLMFTPK